MKTKVNIKSARLEVVRFRKDVGCHPTQWTMLMPTNSRRERKNLKRSPRRTPPDKTMITNSDLKYGYLA